MLLALGFVIEGKQKDAVFRNNRYYDVLDFSIQEADYKEAQIRGDYDIDKLIMRFVQIKREFKKQNKL